MSNMPDTQYAKVIETQHVPSGVFSLAGHKHAHRCIQSVSPRVEEWQESFMEEILGVFWQKKGRG